MITEFTQVLQRLEDMLLSTVISFRRRRLDSICSGDAGLRLAKIIVEILLEIRKFAIIVLNDFWW